MEWTSAGLTLEQKIGQMFIFGFHGPDMNDHARTLVQDLKVGGIIYFRRNFQSLEQLRVLSEQLQQLASDSGQPPLLIAVDQEGGMVARIEGSGISRIPGNMALGAAGNPVFTYETAKISGQELLKLGINMNFAPCLDVNNNPLNPVIGVRSYGEDPHAAALHGAAAVRGFQEEGVTATAKHFPGHGDTSVDSHLGLAAVAHPRRRLEAIELLPFAKAIESGVEAVMTAHVMFPAFEPEETPATLSRAVLTGLLREEMGFSGLIVTDCLEMHAIAKKYGVAEGAVRAVEAGADIVLISHTLDEQKAAITAVIEAVQSGRLSEDRIHASAERILSLKRRKEAKRKAIVSTQQITVPADRADYLKMIALKGITLVRDTGQLPLNAADPIVIYWPEQQKTTQVDEAWSRVYTLGDALHKRGVQVKEIRVGIHMSGTDVDQALQQAEGSQQIVAVTYTSESRLSEGQQLLVQKLAALNPERLVTASTRNPYDIHYLPEHPAYLCCYENTPHFMDALAEILLGISAPEGRLPVSLSGDYPLGC